MPRLLARPPWEDDGTRADGFRYAEYAPEAKDQRPGCRPGYAFAQVCSRAFAQSMWPGDTRGADLDRLGGGIVDEMPIEPFRTDPPGVWNRKSVEIIWNDRQERELLDAGLIPLAAIPNTDDLVFGAARSPLVPQRFTGNNADVANANARLSNQINTIMCASSFRALYQDARPADGPARSRPPRKSRSSLDGRGSSSTSVPTRRTDIRPRYPLIAGKVTREQEMPGKPRQLRLCCVSATALPDR